jgi:methylenetetrahydrofolate dehydrogenase (NADP+)/methenyltetrahydrofolate cyclohydrolase
MQKGATVTQCHSQTKDTVLKTACQYSDILISAVGKAKFINHEYIRLGQTLIDVGINRTSDNKLCGDIDFEDVKDYTYAITPVPGGVGPMTVAELMVNVVQSWDNR